MSSTRNRPVRLGGWGRYPLVDSLLNEGGTLQAARAALAAGPLAVRGAGRSYGDSALAERVLDMSVADRFRDFDPVSGVVCAGAGVTFAELLRVLLPLGWFPPVTPGTRFVTLGGAVASDVHGKNHHVAGSFSEHVESFELLLGSGEVVTVRPGEELFLATCGGMGLTGVILAVRLRMVPVRSSLIEQTTLKLPNLAACIEAFEQQSGAAYSVAWVDCTGAGQSLGRSLMMLGEHAADGPPASPVAAGTRFSVPFELPAGALNPISVRAFNALYYGRVRERISRRTVGVAPFFYPLDAVGSWNRLYGRRGFLQYQFVTPLQAGVEPFARVLGLIADSGMGSPLAVLKTFGPGNANLLSFPTAGYTLALDFPASRKALELLSRLDDIVTGSGGRIYLTKDARMSARTFRSSYPRWEEFQAIRERFGARGVLTSLQARRLEIE